MKILRSALLWASQSPRMERLVRSSRAMRPVVSKFMPGETIDEALAAVRKLKAEGTPTIMTYLGENVSSDAAADHTVLEYEKLFAALKAEKADAHVSIKLTQLGWDVDQGRSLDRVRHLVALAAVSKTVLAIDMESSAYVDSTVAAYEKLAVDADNAALCVQAYLHRTQADVQRLLKLRPFIRLVKARTVNRPTWHCRAAPRLTRGIVCWRVSCLAQPRRARASCLARTIWISSPASGRMPVCWEYRTRRSRYRCCTGFRTPAGENSRPRECGRVC